MKRKVHFLYDDGTIEFSPPLIDNGLPDFKKWMEKENYDKKPEIDDDELIAEYERTYREWQKVCEKIREALKTIVPQT